VERSIQGAMAAVFSVLPDRALGKLATSGPALLAFRKGMEQLMDTRHLNDLQATIRFELTLNGNAHGWLVRVSEGRVSTSANGERPNADTKPDAVLRMDASDFLRIISGQLDVGQAVFDDRIAIDGDVGRAIAVLEHLGPAGDFF
jgi:predicted lipid carrier protein YhbT